MRNTQLDLHVCRQLSVDIRPPRAPRIISVFWSAPSGDWIKCNTDGSAGGAPGPAGGGGIFRNRYGMSCGAFALSMGTQFAFKAELRAAIVAVNEAWNRGWHILWLESDSIYVVNLFNSKSLCVPWECRQEWINCLSLVARMCFKVSHIFREGNRVADRISNYAVSIDGFEWWDSAPIFCRQEHLDDVNRVEQFRFC